MEALAYQVRQDQWQQEKVERERAKANAIPIDGPFRDLAQEVRRLLGYSADTGRPYLPSRRAADLTGINFVSIAKMVRGYPPTPHLLRRFAEKLGGDADLLIKAGQKPSGSADPLARIGTTLTAEEAARLGFEAGEGGPPALPTRVSPKKDSYNGKDSHKRAMEVPETLADRLAPDSGLGGRRRTGPREPTRYLLLNTDDLGEDFRAGDILLLNEDPDVRSGLLAIGFWGGESFRAGYFVRFLDKTFEVGEDRLLTFVGDDFAYLGAVLGFVRRRNLPPAGEYRPELNGGRNGSTDGPAGAGDR